MSEEQFVVVDGIEGKHYDEIVNAGNISLVEESLR